MKEYKIIENLPNKISTEEMLNEHATKGWRVISFQQFQILLERERKIKHEEEQYLLSD